MHLALKRNWEEKNDLGVSSSSSIVGFNTSREQGLFVVPSKSSKESSVLLAGLDEVLFIGDRAYPVSTRLHRHTVHPRGHELLENFYYHPFPTWIFRMEGLTLIKIVLAIYNESTVLIRYQLLSSYGDFIRLQVRPLTAFRSSSELIREDDKFVPKVKVEKGMIHLVSPNVHPDMYIFHNAAVVDRTGLWIKEMTYTSDYPPKEFQVEDLYSPCSFLFPFLKQDGNYLCVSTSPKLRLDPLLLDISEKNRRSSYP